MLLNTIEAQQMGRWYLVAGQRCSVVTRRLLNLSLILIRQENEVSDVNPINCQSH